MTSVDVEISNLPSECHAEIHMAHQVLSSDMAQLISAMRLAQQYSSTLVDSAYSKNMLQAAHILAVDSKNLLDTVDNARRRAILLGRLHAISVPSSNSSNIPNPVMKPISVTGENG
jgi:focal adhesion kinase 1